MRIAGVTGNRRRHAGLAIALTMAMLVAASGQVSVQAPYPNRPIRLIVAYPPGAGTDFTGREVGAQFSKALGQPVVIDNRGGAAQLMTLTGIELVHVPYKGSSLAMTDLLAGNVQTIVTGLLQLLPLHRAGRLRILGVGHPQRLKTYPDIPTIAETVPGYYNTGWWGIAAPAGTPKAIVDKLNAIMNKALATPEVLQRFEKNGLEVATTRRRHFTT